MNDTQLPKGCLLLVHRLRYMLTSDIQRMNDWYIWIKGALTVRRGEDADSTGFGRRLAGPEET